MLCHNCFLANVTQHTTLWTVLTLKSYHVAAWCDVSALNTTQNICRPGVGRASARRQYQTYLIRPADVVRASARRTTPGRCHDFWNSHNRYPTTSHDDRLMQNRPAARLIEFRLHTRPRNVNFLVFRLSRAWCVG